MQAQRRVADPDGADVNVARLAARILVVEHRRRGKGEISAPAGKFLKAPPSPCRPGREQHVDDDLIRGERGHERAVKEVGRLDHTRPRFSEHGNLGLAGHRNARHLGCRIGMGHAAANGAAIADLIMSHFGDGGLEQRMRGYEALIIQDVAPAHHGAEPHAFGGNLDLAQIGELAQIDEQRGLRQPEGQHGYEALAARERLGVVAGGEQCYGLGERGRARILEWRHFHNVNSYHRPGAAVKPGAGWSRT